MRTVTFGLWSTTTLFGSRSGQPFGATTRYAPYGTSRTSLIGRPLSVSSGRQRSSALSSKLKRFGLRTTASGALPASAANGSGRIDGSAETIR
ncbi:MAG TPA: hypothetical protein PKG80_00465 [Acidobacteriota bacterium]|nr:hypothetical protein [Acidobacteriota bacterium]